MSIKDLGWDSFDGSSASYDSFINEKEKRELENFQDWLRNVLVIAVDQSTRLGQHQLLHVNLDCLYYYYGFLDIALREKLKPIGQRSIKNIVEELINHHKVTEEKGEELMAAELIKKNSTQHIDYDMAINFINSHLNELFTSLKQEAADKKLDAQLLQHYSRFLVQLLKTLRSVYEMDMQNKQITSYGGYLGTIFMSGRIDRNLFNVNDRPLLVTNVMQKIIKDVANEMQIDIKNMPELVFHTLGII